MSDLLMRRSAIIGGVNKEYRYELRRVWDDRLPLLVVCMLNPSTADAETDDPTILTLIHFGKLWGYGGLLVVNLFAYRATSPKAMMRARAPVGPGNGSHIAWAMECAQTSGGRLLVAWGNEGCFQGRDGWFTNRALQAYGLELICLGKTFGGAPKHPMARGKHHIPRNQQPLIWRSPIISEAA